MTNAETVDIRRADQRTVKKTSWLESKHSFPFGTDANPRDTHHGLLLVNNEDTIKPGTGFDTHPHRDMEIMT
jgi:quercetin 2,3-dioxygenase